ncbi:hypothetical protein ASE03_15260 [Kitasatospora sp. Root187]|uniref:hypothetical protein n=1 Tax=Kitasatospora sp. Root187 TaxID=1736486 RepID=UPI00070A9435|nr:hypothetical protein [Kitasatospora sp. Root187]KRB75353.1 hypothetical protein ASE03_15260 [Kitasatospora sp. Root187]
MPLSPAGVRAGPVSPDGLLSAPTRVPNGSSGAELRGSPDVGVCCVERGVSFEPEVSRLGALSGEVLDEDGPLEDGPVDDGLVPEGLLPDGLLEDGLEPEGLLLDEGLLLLPDGELPLLSGAFVLPLPSPLPEESALLPCPAALSSPLRA